jgi:hypothetical protein
MSIFRRAIAAFDSEDQTAAKIADEFASLEPVLN